MTLTDLPIIDSCEGCGACCFEQESPPGYVMLLQTPELGEGDSPVAEDLKRLRQLPAEAIEELRTYLARLLSDEVREDRVCIWLDRESKRCRYYDLRPSICRNFELGSAECRDVRECAGVDG